MADTCSSCTTPQRTRGWPAREHGSAHTPRVAYTLEAAEDTLAQQRSREGPQLLITPPSSGGFKSWGFRCPGSKNSQSGAIRPVWGDRPTQKYCFVYFSTEVIIGPVRVPLINGGWKKGHQEACAEAYAQKTQATRAQGISTRE